MLLLPVPVFLTFLFNHLFVSDIYHLDRDQQDLVCKSRNYLAALTLGACLLLRRSIGMDF